MTDLEALRMGVGLIMMFTGVAMIIAFWSDRNRKS